MIAAVYRTLSKDERRSPFYPLSLHDALPILDADGSRVPDRGKVFPREHVDLALVHPAEGDVSPEGHDIDHLHDWVDHLRDRGIRSEEHTSELQSRENLVCRLLLEKKKENRTS